MNIFELAAKISLDDKGFKKGVTAAKKTFSVLGKSASSVAKITGKAGSGLISLGEKTTAAYAQVGAAALDAGDKVMSLGETTAKVTAGISTVIATATAAIVKLATDEYAEYEQLTGGVETLFKDSADTVMKYAKNAYMTAGLSANEYMATVTSFSASLLQSLGGDTAKAAEYADQALTDMSDNANKMGTDMSMIQSAYNGFAKQNYTMLDNLKLGYGGTQEEMKRLISDAAKLDKSVDASSMSFGNIVKAIHAVQTEMGITGTTAKEAASTISGAAGMTKASWKNLLVAMAKGNKSYKDELSALIDSAGIYLDNLLPRVKITLENIYNILDEKLSQGMSFLVTIFGDAAEAAPAVIGKVEKLLKKTVNYILRQKDRLKAIAGKLFEGLINGFTGAVNTVLPLAEEFVPTVVQKIVSFKGALFGVGLDIVGAIANGIGNNADELIGSLIDTVNGAVTKLEDVLPKLALVGSKLLNAIADGLINNGPDIMSRLTDLIVGLISQISNPTTLGKINKAATTLFGSLRTSFDKIMTSLQPLIVGLVPTVAQWLLTKYDILLNAGFDVLMAIVEGIALNIDELAESATSIIVNLVDKITSEGTLSRLFAAASAIVIALVKNLSKPSVINSLATGATTLLTSLVGFIADNVDELIDGALQIIKGLLTGLSAPRNVEKWKEAVPKLIKSLCDALVNLSSYDVLTEIIEGALSIITALMDGMFSDQALGAIGEAAWKITANLLFAVWNLAVDAGKWFMDELAAILFDPEYFTSGRGKMLTQALGIPMASLQANAKMIEEEAAKIKVNGTHRSGLSYVPYDGYIAELHEGERVLTKSEANNYKTGGNVSISVMVNGARYNDEESLATAVAEKIQEMIERKDAAYA